MESAEYKKFTAQLKEKLSTYDRVLGLVAVGSMARQDYQPDEWSDHDFFVIVDTGHQEDFRRDLSWLPDFEDILLSFQETEHGLKVLYNSGHLIEFAVFDREELNLAKVNRYRILIDRRNIESQLDEIRQSTAEESNLKRSDQVLIGQLITNLLVGIGRYNRGEKASAHKFVKMSALKKLLTLFEKHLPAENRELLDDIDPLRRFEFVYPELGKEIESILLEPILETAEKMLNLLKRELPEQLSIEQKQAIDIIIKKYLKEYSCKEG